MKSSTTPNATSSMVSPVGHTLCNSQAGPDLDLFGVPVSHAKASVAPAKDKVLATIEATSGFRSFGSSESADLSRSLANRLKLQLATVGSIEYSQTWKRRVTPAGRVFWEHTASARRISGNGCTGALQGWGTPTVQDGRHATVSESEQNRDPNNLRIQVHTTAGWQTPKSATGKYQNGQDGKKWLNLEGEAELAGWPTPTSNKTTPQSRDNACLARDCALAGWNTPTTEDAGRNGTLEDYRKYVEEGQTSGSRLRAQAQAAGWATCSSRDWKDTPGMATEATNPDGTERTRLDQLPRQAQLASGPPPSGTNAETGKPEGYLLNPHFSRWLQGYPAEWLCSKVLATLSAPRSPRSSSKLTSTPKST